MTILLAPMEGLLDFVLRDVLTRIGGVDRCVSEFIRVTDSLLPDQVFLRLLPELRSGGRTFAGVPVWAQLLGSEPVCLAENAARLAALGPAGIDLNFGCPAKTVNRHRGGAALLDEPEQLMTIVAAVRRAVPAHLPVSAKMRLGVSDASRALECALAIESGGASELVVHARTKADGYRPPAYWEHIAGISAALRIPVIANGEIWSVQDALRCRAVSGCTRLMLGRGMVADPGLALALQAATAASAYPPAPSTRPDANSELVQDAEQNPSLSWQVLLPFIADFWHLVCTRLERRKQAGRLKQWLNFLRRHYPQAELAYAALRTLSDPAEIDQWFARQ